MKIHTIDDCCINKSLSHPLFKLLASTAFAGTLFKSSLAFAAMTNMVHDDITILTTFGNMFFGNESLNVIILINQRIDYYHLCSLVLIN